MNFLISKPMWGLANRLLGLTSAMRLAERHNRTFYLAWEPTIQCMAEFHDLFSAPLPRVRIEGRPGDVLYLDSTGETPDTVRIANVINTSLLDHPRIVMQSHSMVVTHDERFHVRNPFYNGFALDMRGYYERLGLNPAVAGILDRFRDIDFASVVGVHVRRPPPTSNPSEEVFNIPSDALYERLMRFLLSVNPDIRFYLSTNGPQTEAYLQDRFGDRILIYPKRSIDHQQEATAVQDALVDMTLLSRCRGVLRYEPSTFAYFACLMGHTPQIIIGPGPEPENLPVYYKKPVLHGSPRGYLNGTQGDLAALLAPVPVG